MADERDDIAFVKEAFASLRTRRMLLPAVLLALGLTISNVAILYTLPTADRPDHLPYLIAFLLLVLGLAAFAVAILRILNRSVRPPWQPDSSLCLYAPALIASVILGQVSDMVMGGRDSLLAGLASGALAAILRAPLAPWFVAIAVERPLAWRPAPSMRRFSAWLPALALWSLLIVVPLGHLYYVLSRMMVAGAGDWFWPLALIVGSLGAAIELVALALASVAYRRVARS
jgi:hypothetical protein